MSGLNAKISDKPYQMDFLTSTKRFPGMIAGWGTGKTMCAILKGYINSMAFTNNLGLVVRKNFTDLRDSTLKDFELYTGLKVPQHTKEVTLQGSGSTIMFRHGDELSGLQNVNLGWAYMEQAEEFGTDDNFQMLRGRLRRELKPNKDIWNDPYFKIGPVFRPFIEELQRVKPQQAFMIANANGHNWCWQYWIKRQPAALQEELLDDMSLETGISVEQLREMSSGDQFDCQEANSFDNRENLPASFIADLMRLKVDNEQKYNQYVMNSHEAFDLIGSFFARQISKALSEKRIAVVPYDPMAKVFTFWDIGDIYTAIWFIQFQGPHVKVIDFYYDNKGQGIPAYGKMLKSRYGNYGEHWAGPDLDPKSGGNRKSMHTGKYTIDVAREHGINFRIVPSHAVNDRIKATYDFLDLCWFDEVKCKEGLDGLTHYRKKQNENLSTGDHIAYHKTPVDDWTKHVADAFGHLAMAYRYMDVMGEQFGRPKQTMPGHKKSAYNNNTLTRGLIKTA